jgi:heme-degrading monooxygenase HmoA
MAVKILIQRRIKLGKEGELNQAVKQLRSKAVHSAGFISGETLRSVEDPLVHLVICTWKSLEDWNAWVQTAERKGLEEEIKEILTQPEKITPYQYE